MIVVFGSINLDFQFSVPRLPAAGETVLAPAVRLEPGGKGANQAVAAALDRAPVLMAGAVGGDALAGLALAGLRKARVDLTHVVESEAATGCAAVMVDPQGANAIVVGSGANACPGADQIPASLLGPGVTVLLQMETPSIETAALIRRARDHGATIILNFAPALPLARDVLEAVDVLIVNDNEAAALGEMIRVPGDALSLRRALGVDIVRTCGAEGAELATESTLHRIPTLAVAVQDTTGAGDCFCGVLAAGLDRGASLLAAARRGCVAAALSCTRPGAQSSMPSAADIDDALLRQHA